MNAPWASIATLGASLRLPSPPWTLPFLPQRLNPAQSATLASGSSWQLKKKKTDEVSNQAAHEQDGAWIPLAVLQCSAGLAVGAAVCRQYKTLQGAGGTRVQLHAPGPDMRVHASSLIGKQHASCDKAAAASMRARTNVSLTVGLLIAGLGGDRLEISWLEIVSMKTISFHSR
jgi:hypothetical protein